MRKSILLALAGMSFLFAQQRPAVTKQTVALWWWSPDVGWFVRRRLNEEDKVRVIEAVDITRPN